MNGAIAELPADLVEDIAALYDRRGHAGFEAEEDALLTRCWWLGYFIGMATSLHNSRT